MSSTSADAVMRVTPWTEHCWTEPCQLTVEFTYTLQVAQQFCGEAASCRAVGAIALDIAREYIAYTAQQHPPMRPFDGDVVSNFSVAADAEGSPRAQTAVNDGWKILTRQQTANFPGLPPRYDTMSSDFPIFGHDAPNGWEYSFSYVNFVLFPVMLDGQLYLGAVGHNGVGWRERLNILFAVYAAPVTEQDDLAPLAGLIIERKPSGLKNTVVAEGETAFPARQ